MCKKQTSVSHSSTEAKIISLDAGSRLDGLLALELWDLIVSVLGNMTQNCKERRDPLLNKRQACSPPHTIYKLKQSQRVIDDLDNVDFIPSNVQSSRQEALLYVFEDNEAVIKMIIKGRSPTMRHEIISLDAGLSRMGSRLSIFGIWLLKCSILPLTGSRNPKEEYRGTCRVTHHETITPITELRLQLSAAILN